MFVAPKNRKLLAPGSIFLMTPAFTRMTKYEADYFVGSNLFDQKYLSMIRAIGRMNSALHKVEIY